MDRATLTEFAIMQKDTGAIFSCLECIFALQVFLPYLTIGDLEMSCEPVNITSINEKG
jgi:hypothetical protein